METELNWPIIAIGVNVVFGEILVLTRVKHMVSSKRVIVQTKCLN